MTCVVGLRSKEDGAGGRDAESRRLTEGDEGGEAGRGPRRAAAGDEHGAAGPALEHAEVLRDETLQDPRTVFQILKRHYARYTPRWSQEVCGIPVEDFHVGRPRR
jgi:formate dehydrogenase major subunit